MRRTNTGKELVGLCGARARETAHVRNWLDFVEHETIGWKLVGLRGARARETALIGNWLDSGSMEKVA